MFCKKKKKTVNKLIVFLYIFQWFIYQKISIFSEAEKANGITQQKVGECCRRKRKTAGRFIWKYDI